MSTNDDHAKALELLARAHLFFAALGKVPDKTWCYEFLRLTRSPAILTEEGWDVLESAESYLADDPEWRPFSILLFDAEGNQIKNATLAHVLAEVAKRKAARGQAPGAVTVTTFADASDLLDAAGEGGGA